MFAASDRLRNFRVATVRTFDLRSHGRWVDSWT